MSIYGISSSNITGLPLQRPRDGARAPAPPLPPAATTPSTAIAPKSAAGAPAQSVPVEAPQGTDPALWSVLSGDERAFFAKAGAMGPLTYGRAFERMQATQLPASRGGRLDVKV